MSGKQKRLLRRILLTALLFLTAGLLPTDGWRWYLRLLCYLVPYLTIGFPILKKAGVHILHGQVFDENFLMAVASLGALAIGEFAEAVFVLLFYEVGELFESFALGRSRRSITALMELRPETAVVLRDGAETEVPSEEVGVGETIRVRPGEKVPLDGVIVEGSSSLNTSPLTGESLPCEVTVGDTALSGSINGGSPLLLRVTRPFEESTASKILKLVESSAANKAKSEAFITRFAKYYTPIVVFAALALALLPPLFDGQWSEWTYRALSFLVISCPCALVISVPLSFFAGIGGASRQGILVKGSQYLERLATATTAVFDKTGTLTKGRFSVKEILPKGISEEELLRLAASVERDSDHPIALSLKAAAGERGLSLCRPTAVEVLAGYGIRAQIDGEWYYAGNGALMDRLGVAREPLSGCGTVVFLSREQVLLGSLVVADTLKEGSREALLSLKASGIRRMLMLTGDNAAAAASIAEELPLDGVSAELLPDGKVSEVERLLAEQEAGKALLYVGDGINDAPVLARADIGIAMGALGSDAAMEAADIVIMDDDLRRLSRAVSIARKTKRIVRQNIVLSLLIKIGVLLLTALGLCGMWVAVFADVGVMVLAVLNALRAYT